MLAGFCLLAPGPAWSATYSALPTKDTYADEANPTVNYRDSGDLALSATTGARRRVFLDFDLPAVPATEELTRAVLRFWVKDAAGSPVDVFRITTGWTSDAVTWNAQPGYGSTVRGTFEPLTSGAFAEVDITPLVRSWMNGSLTNDGVALIVRSGTSLAIFQSQNVAPDNQHPVLVMTTVTKPQLELTEGSQVVSDPFRGTVNPKRIPGAVLQSVLTVVNRAPGSNDAGTLDIRQQIPPQTSLRVADLGAAGSGPLLFAQGTPPSGLTYTFSGLSSTTDDLGFSSDGGVTYGYTPIPDADGYDSAVTHVRLTPKGAFAPAGAGGQPSVTATMRVRAR